MWDFIVPIIIIILILLSPLNGCDYPTHLYEKGGYDYKTAHFVYGLWDSSPLPDHFKETMDLWAKQGWEIKLWNKDMIDALLEKYPDYKSMIPSFSRKVQIADLARLLILYDEGGHYFDLDCVPTENNLYEHLAKYKPDNIFYLEVNIGILWGVIVGLTESIRNFDPESPCRIANYSFGSKPNDPVIKKNLDLLKERCEKYKDYNSDYDVLYKTGPDCTTTAVMSENDKNILKHDFWMKHNATGTWRKNKDG